MELYGRQGDIVISKGQLTGDLKPMKDPVIAGSSSGHRHTVVGQHLGRRNGTAVELRLAAPTEMVHSKSDGHATAQLEAGDYTFAPLRESRDGLEDQDVTD